MSDTKPFVLKPICAALIVSAVSMGVYLTTMAPGLDFIDSGELATDVYTLGICHPTGYPLFTLVGFLFSHLPIASSVILRLNFMAVFFTALGTGGLTLVVHEITLHWLDWSQRASKPQQKPAQQKHSAQKKGSAKQPQAKSAPAPQTPPIMKAWNAIAAGMAAGLTAAFSKTWWDQSTSIEVYPLHIFLVPLVIYFFLKMLREDDPAKPELTKNATLFAVLLGLSFTNHMTTVLLAPACLFLYFAKRGFNPNAFLRILWLAIPFCSALLLYLYMPIRAAQNPIMDWGHPTTLSAFLKHVTGGQYSIWMFKGSAGDQWKYFRNRLPGEFTIVGFVLALIGVLAMGLNKLPSRWKILVFTSLLFVGCLYYALNYGIHDIDSYFVLAYLATAIWIGAAAGFLLEFFGKNRNAGIGIALLFAAFVTFECVTNYADADESGNHMVDDYAHNLLSNLPKNALIFSTQWDFWLSGAYYEQIVEKYRPDVIVIDRAMLRDRPWYSRYLERRWPETMAKVKLEEEAFLKYLVPFDNGDEYDHAAIGTAYTDFTRALVSTNLDRPIYATSEVLGDQEEPFGKNMKPIPAGVAFRLMSAETFPDVPLPNISWRDEHYKKRNYYTDNSRLLQATPLAATAEQYARLGNLQKAEQFVDLALKFLPAESIEGLEGRDYDFALETNERFGAIEKLKAQITAAKGGR